jgi:hypothetical protein
MSFSLGLVQPSFRESAPLSTYAGGTVHQNADNLVPKAPLLMNSPPANNQI